MSTGLDFQNHQYQQVEQEIKKKVDYLVESMVNKYSENARTLAHDLLSRVPRDRLLVENISQL